MDGMVMKFSVYGVDTASGDTAKSSEAALTVEAVGGGLKVNDPGWMLGRFDLSNVEPADVENMMKVLVGEAHGTYLRTETEGFKLTDEPDADFDPRKYYRKRGAEKSAEEKPEAPKVPNRLTRR